MILNGFAGRTVRQVERQDECVKVAFEDGGYLYVRVKGPTGASLKISCACTKCVPAQCDTCRGIERTASE